MSQLKCNCYINGERKSKADRKTCTDVKTHIYNKQIDDHFGFADSDEESDEKEIESKSDGASQPGQA